MRSERPRRAILRLAAGLFIICIPLFLLSSHLTWAVNSIGLYQYGFDRYDVSQDTGLSDGQLREIGLGLIHYFNSGQAGAELELFNEREMTHLQDVRGLIQANYRLQGATLGYMLAFVIAGLAWQRRRVSLFARLLARASLGGSLLTLASLIVLGIAYAASFGWLFECFHRLFFSGDSWILSGYLPRIFPEAFFADAALFIAAAIALESLVLGSICAFFVLKWRRERLEAAGGAGTAGA